MTAKKTKTIACGLCGGTEVPTTTTHHIQRHGTVYVFENVPAFTCDTCNEIWLEGKVLHRLDQIIDAGYAPAAPVVNFDQLVTA